MLDRNTFKKRLNILLNYFEFTDKLYDLTDGYFTLFAIKPLEDVTTQYETMLIELIGEQHKEDIEYWLDNKISEEKTITVKVSGKHYNITDIDDFYDYLKEYHNDN